MNILRILIGLAALVAGRALYWLFVGAAGFALGLTLAGRALQGSPDWLVILIGLAAGAVGALLAAFVQRVAVALAGFVAGGFVALSLLEALNMAGGSLDWIVALVAGVLGLILASLVLDWALIILSSLTGAALIVQAVRFGPLIEGLLFLVLLGVGIAIQASQMPREEPA